MAIGSSLKFTRLLKNLYGSFNKDERIVQVFDITYGGLTANYTIVDDFLRLTTSGGSSDDFYIDLSTHTIQTLANEIASNTIYTVTTVSDFSTYADLNATSLIDRESQSLQDLQQKKFFIYTSILWIIFKAIAREFQDACDTSDSSLRQMNILTAEDIFLDHWARDYYNEARLEGEDDYDYSRRTIATIIRPKVNDIALELILEDILNFDSGTVRVITDPLLNNANFTPGAGMIDPPVSEDQLNNKDFDNILFRMIGGEGINNPYTVNQGCFTVWILPAGDCIPVPNSDLLVAINRFRASGTCFTLRYLNISDDVTYSGATLDDLAGTGTDVGIYWSYSWIIRGDFTKVRGDFNLGRRINFHATSESSGHCD